MLLKGSSKTGGTVSAFDRRPWTVNSQMKTIAIAATKMPAGKTLFEPFAALGGWRSPSVGVSTGGAEVFSAADPAPATNASPF
jgi:hypothetical protein